MTKRERRLSNVKVGRKTEERKKRILSSISGIVHLWMQKYFPWLITALFFILSLIGILHHEMWRDEYQAWMCADDAHSIPQLLQNIKYEGHPVLWHLILFVLSAVTQNMFWMQFVHILITGVMIFLFNRFSPIPILEKILFTFGYFIFYEYNVISRSYALGVLFIVIFCILYKNRQKNILWISAVLVLFSNLSVFGVIFSICFSGILLFENIFMLQKQNFLKIPLAKLILFCVITLTGVIVGYLQIKPEPDNTFQTIFFTHFDLNILTRVSAKFIGSYFSYPDISTIHFWNTNLFIGDTNIFSLLIASLLLLYWVMAFMRFRIVFILYIAGTFAMFSFYYYTGLMFSRYIGHLFLILMVCNWLIYYIEESPFKNNLIENVSLVASRFRRPMLIIILFVHFCGGITAYVMDLKYPFSTSYQATAFIRDHHLMNYEFFGSKDYILSPISAQLHKKILYGERHDYGSFIIYDLKRNNILTFRDIEPYIEEMYSNGIKHILFMYDKPIFVTFNDSNESVPWKNALLTTQLNMKEVAHIEPGIVDDETYYIYTIDEVRSK